MMSFRLYLFGVLPNYKTKGAAFFRQPLEVLKR